MPIAAQIKIDPRQDDGIYQGGGPARWWRTAYTFASLVPFGAATVATFTFPGFPWGSCVHGAFARLTQNFVGAGAITFVLTFPVGIDLITAVSVAAGAPSTLPGLSAIPRLISPNANGPLFATFTGSTALSGLTAGKLELFMQMSVVELQS